MISHALDVDKEVSGPARKHINRCSECRRFHETSQALAELLRQEAVQNREEDFGRLRERIMTQMEKEPTKIQLKVRRFHPAVISAAAAVIIVLGGVTIYKMTVLETQPVRPDASISWSLDSSTLLAMLDSELTEDNIKQTWPVVLEKPINQEIDNLVADTTSAVEFLMACTGIDFTDSAAN